MSPHREYRFEFPTSSVCTWAIAAQVVDVDLESISERLRQSRPITIDQKAEHDFSRAGRRNAYLRVVHS